MISGTECSTSARGASGIGNPTKAVRGVIGGSFSADPAPIMPSIPESAVWAQLIVGLGLVGSVARRRKGKLVRV